MCSYKAIDNINQWLYYAAFTMLSKPKINFPFLSYYRIHCLPRSNVGIFSSPEVLADRRGRRLLSPSSGRPSWSEGREPSARRQHEHQDRRFRLLKLLQLWRTPQYVVSFLSPFTYQGDVHKWRHASKERGSKFAWRHLSTAASDKSSTLFESSTLFFFNKMLTDLTWWSQSFDDRYS